jgi:SAM-dependent methyltransferase
MTEERVTLREVTEPLSYDAIVRRLSQAYDGGATERDQRPRAAWKVALREAFLARLLDEGKERLVELGAGPGHDSLFFQEAGLTVTAIDPSPEMVGLCRAKGLDARRGDFLNPGLPPESADAIWAMNSLLHVPNAELPGVLDSIRSLLRPGGLFFLGVYGGRDEEGVAPQDDHDPPRFFSFRSDDRLRAQVDPHFDVVEFKVVNEGTGDRSQALTLRRPDTLFSGATR